MSKREKKAMECPLYTKEKNLDFLKKYNGNYFGKY